MSVAAAQVSYLTYKHDGYRLCATLKPQYPYVEIAADQ